VKITVDGVDANGKPAHNEWTGKFDGKDYSITEEVHAAAATQTIFDCLGISRRRPVRIPMT
jgi:hypothetical protein